MKEFIPMPHKSSQKPCMQVTRILDKVPPGHNLLTHFCMGVQTPVRMFYKVDIVLSAVQDKIPPIHNPSDHLFLHWPTKSHSSSYFCI